MSGGWWARVASVVALAGVLGGCRGGGGPRTVPPSDDHWLVVWAGDADRRHSDFLAIIDPGGKVVRTIPVKSAGNEPQDVNSDLRRDRHVFATGALTNRTFVFDLRDPSEGKLVHIDDPGTSRPLAGPRGIANLPGGRVAIACADPTGYRGEPREVVRSYGGLRILGDDGGFVRDVPASGEASKGFIVAPAAVAGAAVAQPPGHHQRGTRLHADRGGRSHPRHQRAALVAARAHVREAHRARGRTARRREPRPPHAGVPAQEARPPGQHPPGRRALRLGHDGPARSGVPSGLRLRRRLAARRRRGDARRSLLRHRARRHSPGRRALAQQGPRATRGVLACVSTSWRAAATRADAAARARSR